MVDENKRRKIEVKEGDSKEDLGNESSDLALEDAAFGPLESEDVSLNGGSEGGECSGGEENDGGEEAPQEEERDADFSKLDKTDHLLKEKAEARQAAAENYDKYLRALADLENYKKRALKERSELLKYQGESVFSDLVEVVDDLDRAMSHAEGDAAAFRSGIDIIYSKFKDILAKWEVRGESALGERFDPMKQHALSRLPTADAVPGTVINELKRAYFYKDKLIRAGEVVVAAEPPPAEPEEVEAESESDAEVQNAGTEGSEE